MEIKRIPKKTPWYLITEILFFILPIILLIKNIKNIEKKALFFSLVIIVGLGYGWSMIVSANQWWTFNSDIMLGLEILPHLPLEEALFYPLGGVLCILLYLIFKERLKTTYTNKKLLIGIMSILTILMIVLVLISVLVLGNTPYYVISKLILYNGLCFILWPKIGNKVLLMPLLLTTIIMSVIGFAWDWIAFKLSWWTYQAVLGWYYTPGVPIDDIEFFMFAPLSAVALYVLFSKGDK